jgi:signal transduction histidine kinase
MLRAAFRDGRQLLRLAGFASLVLVGVPNLLKQVVGPELGTTFPVLDGVRLTVWLGAALAFGYGFWQATGTRASYAHRTLGMLFLQVAAALTMFSITCTGYESLQLVIVAAELGLLFPLRPGMIWIVVMSAFQAWLGTFHWPPSGALMWAFALTLPYELLALLTSHFAASQARARESLSRTNAELQATQALLAHSSRMAERVRISRELHDLLGHHLAALNLQLEAATHLVEGRATEPVAKARAVARRLLADLRVAVGTLREKETVDLSRAIAPLAEAVERPRTHLKLPPKLAVRESELGQALIRCLQEIITNAAKHADADNLWIEVALAGAGLEVHARDDGRGVEEITSGHGLEGMRERIEALGGRVEVRSEPARGFRVDAWLPLAGEVT